MRKTLTLLIGLALASVIHMHAQTYVRTNMQVAATITNGTTYTYAGTNFVDASRYSEVGFEHSASGPGVETNNYVYTFKLSNDATNYAGSPTLIWVANGARALTNFTLGTYGHVQLFTRVSTNAIDHTNSSLYGYLKGYRRD